MTEEDNVLINKSDKYYTDYRLVKSWFNDIMSGNTGYVVFAPAYVSKETNQVCWFATKPGYDGSHIVEQPFRLEYKLDGCVDEVAQMRNLVQSLENAKMLSIVEANDYLKGGKHHDLALQWFEDNNISSVPEIIY